MEPSGPDAMLMVLGCATCGLEAGSPPVIHHAHEPVLVVLSVVIASFASYTALDLANSLSVARGRARAAWLTGGSLAMGVGIWSMHFVAMLAFRAPGLRIAYDVPLLVLSVLVAIAASAIALSVVSGPRVTAFAYTAGSLSMGAAIAGMHYIGIASMRMAASIEWSAPLVAASIAIAVTASLAALWLAFRLRRDAANERSGSRAAAGVVMGFAIAGMHYTAMAAMRLREGPPVPLEAAHLLATSGLAVSVVGTTVLILGIALSGSIVDRALARREAMTEQITGILESITDAFYSVDRQWRFTYVNRVARDKMAEVLERDPGPLVGQVMWDVAPWLLGTRFEEEYRRAMSERVPRQLEEPLPARGGWIEARAYPSPDGLSVYFRDVSDRKRHEEALQEAIRARDEFLSVASHELKTPLTSLHLQTQTRLRHVERADAAYFSLEKLASLFQRDAQQIVRLTRLIDDMLDIARVTTGKLTIRREPVDLCALTQDLVERYEGQIEAAGCTVRLQYCESVVGSWDRLRIEQVVANLLTNALRYGRGSPIDIAVAFAAPPAGALGGGPRPGERWARVTVRDRGIGIAKDDQERIFQRFERAAGESAAGGLGLGLYIARQLVDMHGGTIHVESEPGQGATFVVDLPLDGNGDPIELSRVAP